MKLDSQNETLLKKDREIMQEVKNLTTRVDQLSALLFQKKSYHEVKSLQRKHPLNFQIKSNSFSWKNQTVKTATLLCWTS